MAEPIEAHVARVWAELEQAHREFESLFAAKDAVSLVAGGFVEDALKPIAFPPGGVPPVEGRAQLVEMFQGQFQLARAIRLETIRLEVAGDLAYEAGRARVTLAEGPVVFGRYNVLWRRIQNQWRAQVDFISHDGWPDSERA